MKKYFKNFTPALVDTFRSGYSLSSFFKDFSAGATIGIMALPVALAFAIASGLSPEHGLYTAIVGGLAMAIFSGSHFQVSGPIGAFVILIHTIIVAHGYNGLVITMILAGIMLIIAGLCRLGGLVKYIPFPVIIGFTSGVSLFLITSQIRDFFGLPLSDIPTTFFAKWHLYITNIDNIHLATVAVALLTMAIILLCQRITPRLPSFIIAIILSTALTSYANIQIETIGSFFGQLPQGLPTFTPPTNVTLDLIIALLPNALTIAIIIGMASLLSCVMADSMTKTRHNSNMELVSQGIGNIICAFFGGFVAAGTLARTANSIQAGAVSPIAPMIHSALLLACLVWFMPLMEYIPLSSLAAIMVFISIKMVDVQAIKHIFKGTKSDWSVMLLTCALTVLTNVTVAVLSGVVLAKLIQRSKIYYLQHTKRIC